MKKILILSGIILSIFLIIILNCQQPTSGGGGGSSGDNDGESLRVTRVSAGFIHSVVLLNNGTVKCWGNNFYGQLGYGDTNNRGDEPGEMGDNLPTVNLGSVRSVNQIAAGGYHTLARLDDASIKCWGNNEYGQLGYGDTEDRGDEPGEMGDNLLSVQFGLNRKAVQIAAGLHHTVVHLDDGSVKCFGRNQYGQLGIESNENIGDEPGEMNTDLYDAKLTGGIVKNVAAGDHHTVVLFYNGTVKCWGNNTFGQLGYGDTEDRGDEPGEMGDALPTVDLGTGRTAVQITAGSDFTAVLLDDGTVKCWGRNHDGQLGYGDTNARGYIAGQMGDSLPAVNLGTGRYAVQIAAGGYHVLALLNGDGLMKCWGWNLYGQLGYGDTNNRGDNAGEMGNNLSLVNWGLTTPLMQIAVGAQHSILLTGDGTGRVKCWGRNLDGQLGYGNTETRGDGPGEMGNDLPFVSLW